MDKAVPEEPRASACVEPFRLPRRPPGRLRRQPLSLVHGASRCARVTIPSPGKGRLKVAHSASGGSTMPQDDPSPGWGRLGFLGASAKGPRRRTGWSGFTRHLRFRLGFIGGDLGGYGRLSLAGLEGFEVYQGSCRTAPLRSRLGCLPETTSRFAADQRGLTPAALSLG